MHYTLGLDIGISSVGWAVLQNMSDGEPFKIEDLGVRIFEKAEQPKTGASLALSRREARGARRRLRRRRHRKERVKALLHYITALTPPTYQPCSLQGVLLQLNGISYLEVSFTLRCFQRLSHPHFATLLCRWRDNRCTIGAFIPVLSY